MSDEAPTTTIWVVWGTTGEYSDRETWLVAAYTAEADARAHAKAANAEAAANGAKRGPLEWDPSHMGGGWRDPASYDATAVPALFAFGEHVRAALRKTDPL